MAKKSSKKKTAIEHDEMDMVSEVLANFMDANGVTPDDLMQLMLQMSGNPMMDFYEKVYNYKKPDYTKMIEPLHPALVPIIEREEVRGLSEDLKQALLTLNGIDHAVACKALTNALYYILANQEKLQEDNHTNLPLFAILHLMIELRVEGATPAIVELLNQDGHFFQFFFDAFEEDMSFAIAKLCKDRLKDLESFMYATGRIPQTKYIVADAVIHMALINPTVRIAVISWFARVLTRYADITVYETNIDHITKSLAQLKAKELNPLIQHLYDIKTVPFIEVTNKTELEHLLKYGTDERRIATESLAEIIETVENRFSEDDRDDYGWNEEDEDWDEDDDWDEDEDEDDFPVFAPRDAEILVEENEDGQLYRLEVTLDRSPVEVKRELIVPSNIRLSWLSRVLIIAMGWEGCHLDMFSKGKEYYGSIDDDWSDCEDYEEYALNDLLKRKNSMIHWEYDFGDSWMHTIKLTEKIKCKGRPVIEATKAVNACPPEDCGGVWGYEEMLSALANDDDPEHDTWAEWIDEDFDPHYVSLDQINAHLKVISSNL